MAGKGRDTKPDEKVSDAFARSVEEGRERLTRSWPALFATGTVGGLDVGVGVMAQLVVVEATGEEMWGALAFSIGFIALTLARSELFTENFLVPITAWVADDKTRLPSVLRLWGGTLAANLAGGWVIMMLVANAIPELHADILEAGRHFPALGIGVEAFTSAVVAGMVVTLLTWLEHAAPEVGARVVAAVLTGFVLAAGPLNHTVVRALEMFGALVVGAPFGYADAAGATLWAVLGNMVGGIGLVTVVRLVQTGRGGVQESRNRSS